MRLEQRFEARPVAEEIAHAGGFGKARGKVALGNGRVLWKRADSLDIHADLYVPCHRHQRQSARMREIEADFRRRGQIRFPLFVEREFEWGVRNARKDGAQRGVGAQVAPAQRWRSKPRGAQRFLRGGR